MNSSKLFALAGATMVSLATTVRADDIKTVVLDAVSDIGKSAVGSIQQYATGMGPGKNRLIDVSHTQSAKIKEAINFQGIQNLNSVYVTDSNLRNVKTTQVIQSDRISNEQGMQRLNAINIAHSKSVQDVDIKQQFKVKTAENKLGLQQVNVVGINHAEEVRNVKITQVAQGNLYKNEQGVQSINTIAK